MKNLFLQSRLFYTLILFFTFIIQCQVSYGQSCDQLEILYTEPSCFARKQGSPVGTSGDNACMAASACVNQPYEYISSITGLGFTYSWVATGPSAVTFVPNNNSAQVKIVWPIIGDYTLTLTVTDNLGNVFTKCLTISVKEKPNAAFTFTSGALCAGSVVQFTNGSTFGGGGMLYSWDFDDPSSNSNYSSALSPNHQFNNPGSYDVTLIVSSFELVIVAGSQGHKEEFVQKVCCSDTVVHQVTIDPGTMKIECITTMCANETAIYTAVGCLNPIWSVPIGGSVLSTSGNTITIQWGNGAVQGQLSANCGAGSCTTTVQIPIIPAVPVAVGNISPCLTSTESYTLPVLPGTFYGWTLTEFPGGVNKTSHVYTFPDNNTAWINWQNVTGGVYTAGNTYQLGITLLNKHNCCGPITNFITIIPKETFSAFNDQEVCLGGTASLYTFPSYGTFSWSVVPVAGVSPSAGIGSSFSPTFSASGNYIATVNETANSYCNSPGAKTVKITVLPATPSPSTIIGPTSVCLTDILPYSMSAAAPAGYHYNWAIPMGTGTFEPGAMTTTNGDAVNVQWTVVPGQISVFLERNSFPFCPSPAVTLNVSQATTGAVTGTANICVDSNGSYTLTGGTVPPGTTVTWSVTSGSGTIISGQGTTNVIIKWHSTGGTGTWPGTVAASTTCGIASPFNVTIYPKFTIILSQTSDICQPTGTTLTATLSPPVFPSTYLWTGGSTTNPTSVFTAGTYTLLVTNAGGCTATNQIEVLDPFKVVASCSIGLCTATGMSEVLTVSATAPGGIIYQWFTGTSPAGTSILGANTNTYTATVGGNYYVEVYYGTCMKFVQFNIAQVCCPDVNKPSIVAVQNSCFNFTFTSASLVAGKPYTLFYGDGSTATGITNGAAFVINHNYPPTAAVYCVKLRIDNGACGVNWAATSVVVPIKAQFFYQLACNGCPTITNTSINFGGGTVTYDWDFGDGFVSLGNVSPTPPAHCYTVAGTYTLQLTMNYVSGLITCTDVFSLPITYAPLSISVVPATVCTNNIVTFNTINGSASLVNYTWDFGDGSFAYSALSAHSYLAASPPNYNVMLTVIDVFGNTCSATSSINVLPGFMASLTPGFICPGGSATLTPTISGPGGIYSYAWEEFVLGNWVPAVGANTNSTYTTTTAGTFHVIITGPNGCMVTTNLVPVINVPNPVAKISVAPSKKLCFPGGFVTLNSDNHLPGYTSKWYVGSISIANELSGSPAQNVSLFVSVSDNYFLVLTNQYGCQDICQIFIEVNAPPATPIIAPAGPVCEGMPTVLSIPPTTNSILWNTGESANSITVYKAGLYSVVVTNPLTGCSSTSQKVVNKRPNVDLFPHFCQKVDCDCIVPFAIYAPRPLVGLFAPSPAYTVQWFNSPSNTLITMGVSPNGLNYTNLPIGVQTGSYYIKMTDPSTGCTNTSEIYSVTVPTIQECDNCSCDLGSWGTVTLTTVSPISTIIIPCPSVDPTTIACRVPYIISGNYNCSAPGCVSEIKYSITDPASVTVTGSLPYTFTAPVSGLYQVTLTAYCDGVACTVCKFTFNACPPLEVNLISFMGKKVNKTIELNWRTASEINNNYYDLEKSEDGSKFVKLAKINSKNGDSKEALDYKFIDEFPNLGVNYYRLKAIDLEGKASLSKIISVDFTEPIFAKIYPNPTKLDRVTIEIPLEKSEKILLEWLDVLGRQVKTNSLMGNKGQNKFEISVDNLPVGRYLIKIDIENNNKIKNTLNFEKL